MGVISTSLSILFYALDNVINLILSLIVGAHRFIPTFFLWLLLGIQVIKMLKFGVLMFAIALIGAASQDHSYTAGFEEFDRNPLEPPSSLTFHDELKWSSFGLKYRSSSLWQL